MPRRSRGDVSPTPHDAIIQHVFSQREHAAGLIKAAVAGEITGAVDWSTLGPAKAHFVDSGLRGRRADLFFSARMGEDRVFIQILIEHQSTVDPLMIARMGIYMWRQWEHLLRTEPARRKLPPILPILIHHSETGWTAATAFEDLIAAPPSLRDALRPFIPSFQMKLVDVSRDPASGLVDEMLTALGKLVLFCLSVAGNSARLAREIDGLVPELNTVFARPDGLDARLALLRYLVATHGDLGVTAVRKLVESAAAKGQEEIPMDVFDQMEEKGLRRGLKQGLKEGRKQGIEEGRRDALAGLLLQQLAARFGGVPARVRAQILAAGHDDLSRWGLRVLTAPTLSEVLDDAAPARASKKTAAPRPAARKRAPRAR